MSFKFKIFHFLLFTFYFSLFTSFVFPEVIDRIVAVVNNQVITLTELKIARAFRLYPAPKSKQIMPASFYLEKLIEQRLVTQVAGQQVKVENSEVEAYLEKIRNNLGPKVLEAKLQEFGLGKDDLEKYIYQRILEDKIIRQKLFQNVAVTLEDIENYYQQIYLPSQKAKGFKPQPLLEIVNKIEAVIKENKRREQVKDWIANLKRQADIQIKVKNLDEYFKK
ncbi:MAG: hypothetical protein ACE5GI_02355 [Candidatus Aminicenantales bacterium]